jgi:glycosyltransferase involved in cell wall biosynthesis
MRVMEGGRAKISSDVPLVSVLICAYNAQEFIEATIRSVMAQTYRNLEVLVLDNNSSDGTVAILEGLKRQEARLRLYGGKKNLGAYGGLNYLLERAAGTYIAIQDHDDIWHQDKIARQVDLLERNHTYVGCGAAIINYYEKYDIFLLRRQPAVSRIAWHTSLIFRNSGLRYNARAKIANDFLFMKHVLCARGKRIYNLEEPYVLRTIRADGSNLSTKWINRGALKEILWTRIGILDRLALVNRLLLPARLADFLVLKVFLRKNIRSPADVMSRFGLDAIASGHRESPSTFP